MRMSRRRSNRPSHVPAGRSHRPDARYERIPERWWCPGHRLQHLERVARSRIQKRIDHRVQLGCGSIRSAVGREPEVDLDRRLVGNDVVRDAPLDPHGLQLLGVLATIERDPPRFVGRQALQAAAPSGGSRSLPGTVSPCGPCLPAERYEGVQGSLATRLDRARRSALRAQQRPPKAGPGQLRRCIRSPLSL